MKRARNVSFLLLMACLVYGYQSSLKAADFCEGFQECDCSQPTLFTWIAECEFNAPEEAGALFCSQWQYECVEFCLGEALDDYADAQGYPRECYEVQPHPFCDGSPVVASCSCTFINYCPW